MGAGQLKGLYNVRAKFYQAHENLLDCKHRMMHMVVVTKAIVCELISINNLHPWAVNEQLVWYYNVAFLHKIIAKFATMCFFSNSWTQTGGCSPYKFSLAGYCWQQIRQFFQLFGPSILAVVKALGFKYFVTSHISNNKIERAVVTDSICHHFTKHFLLPNKFYIWPVGKTYWPTCAFRLLVHSPLNCQIVSGECSPGKKLVQNKPDMTWDTVSQNQYFLILKTRAHFVLDGSVQWVICREKARSWGNTWRAARDEVAIMIVSTDRNNNLKIKHTQKQLYVWDASCAQDRHPFTEITSGHTLLSGGRSYLPRLQWKCIMDTVFMRRMLNVRIICNK